MKRIVLSWLVIGGAVIGLAQGANIRYKQSGPWEWLQDVGQPQGWQKATPPDGTDTVRANWGNNTITLDFETTVGAFQSGVDESGTFHILAGGILNAGNSKVGNNNDCTGGLTIDAGGRVNATGGWLMIAGNSTVKGVADVSGTLAITGHLWMATGAGSNGTLDINDGGLVSVGGMLGLGTVNASTPSGGNATININDGGTLNLANIHGEGTSVHPGSIININGTGKIEMTGGFIGHFTNATKGYVPNGYIAGNGVVGNVEVVHDSGTNLTTVTALPAPELPTVELGISDDPGGFLLTWTSDDFPLYNVLSSDDGSDWDLVEGDIPASGTGTNTKVVPDSATVLLYRIEGFMVAVLNSSFEDPVVDDGDLGVIATDWILDDVGGVGTVSTFNPLTPDDYTAIPDGENVANVQFDTVPGVMFGLTQVLGATFATGTDYTVTVDVGRSLYYDWSGYRIELLAGGTLLAADDDLATAAPTAGTFITSTLSYDSATAAAVAEGTPLELRLLSRGQDVGGSEGTGWAVDFDNVTFSATTP